MKFFVVDDDQRDRAFLVELLRDRFPNDEIEEAANGLESRDKLFERPEDQLPDLVLTDFQMPGLNGLKFIKSIRESSVARVAELKIVLLTSFISDRVPAEAAKLKCWFIQKPFRPEDFYRLLDDALGKTTP